ncbi:MAG: phytoene/squalene synthase family protein [Bacteroidetes bacterium]|nr:MAG: phytoene/squalene synthase family protein [Bacteroidota bacterium]
MTNATLYLIASRKLGALITALYSTSFNLATHFLGKGVRQPVRSLYGFVRLADEIVDTFHDQPQRKLLERFREDTREAIRNRFSIHPVLHAFQDVVHAFSIEQELIEAFFDSMAMDLNQSAYARPDYEQYIYGSAEVVGLMCLRIFSEGDERLYRRLKPYARSLGAAFQKVNFLRDFKDDYQELGRIYFPELDFSRLDETSKERIIQEIEADFAHALEGIRQLPLNSRLAVYIAYVYYRNLLEKIRRAPVNRLLEQRVRIPNGRKMYLMGKAILLNRLNIIR